MNAKEMFEQDNEWKLEEQKDIIAYTLDQPTWGHGGAHFGIVFTLSTKSYHTYVFFNNRADLNACSVDAHLSITPGLHLAITQQMKELGWPVSESAFSSPSFEDAVKGGKGND